jgi:hypothetical protein
MTIINQNKVITETMIFGKSKGHRKTTRDKSLKKKNGADEPVRQSVLSCITIT